MPRNELLEHRDRRSRSRRVPRALARAGRPPRRRPRPPAGRFPRRGPAVGGGAPRVRDASAVRRRAGGRRHDCGFVPESPRASRCRRVGVIERSICAAACRLVLRGSSPVSGARAAPVVRRPRRRAVQRSTIGARSTTGSSQSTTTSSASRMRGERRRNASSASRDLLGQHGGVRAEPAPEQLAERVGLLDRLAPGERRHDPAPAARSSRSASSRASSQRAGSKRRGAAPR